MRHSVIFKKRFYSKLFFGHIRSETVKMLHYRNDTLVNEIFMKNNKNRDLREIDLHHLTVNEAIQKLIERIKSLYSVHSVYKLVVIVGRGIHSENGPVLKPAVFNFARKNDICTEVLANPGRIILIINNASQIQSLESASTNVRRSSIGVHSHSKEVTLADYVTQAVQKQKKRKQQGKNRTNDIASSENVYLTQQKDTAHIPQNAIGSKKQKKRKCSMQLVDDFSNEMPASSNPRQIPQIENGAQDIEQKKRKHSTKTAKDGSQKIPSPRNKSQIQRKEPQNAIGFEYITNTFYVFYSNIVMFLGRLGLQWL